MMEEHDSADTPADDTHADDLASGLGEWILQDAIADGFLVPLPISTVRAARRVFAGLPDDDYAPDAPLWLDLDCARALGLPVEGRRGASAEVLAGRVATLRHHALDLARSFGGDDGERHYVLPFGVDGKGMPSCERFVALIRQEGCLWVTQLRRADPPAPRLEPEPRPVLRLEV